MWSKHVYDHMQTERDLEPNFDQHLITKPKQKLKQTSFDQELRWSKQYDQEQWNYDRKWWWLIQNQSHANQVDRVVFDEDDDDRFFREREWRVESDYDQRELTSIYSVFGFLINRVKWMKWLQNVIITTGM